MKFQTLFSLFLLPALVLAGCSGDKTVQGKPLGAWLQALHAPDASRRLEAAQALAARVRGTSSVRQVVEPKVIQALEGALRDRNPDVRLEAALALAWNGYDTGMTVPVLLEALRDSGIPALHRTAHQVVVHRGRWVESSLSSLLQRMEQRLPDLVPVSAAQSGPRNPGQTRAVAIAAAGKLAQSPEPEILGVLEELGRDGLAAPAVVTPAVAGLLKHPSAPVRAAAARILGTFGPYGFTALGGLNEMLQGDPDPAVRAAAVRSMMRIDPQTGSTVYYVHAALSDRDPAVRRAAALALGDFGASARAITETISHDLLQAITVPQTLAMRVVAQAIGPLQGALKNDTDPSVRAAAARALGRISPVIEKVVPSLLAALGDGDPSVRAAAAQALGELGAGEKGVREKLEALLKDAQPAVRGAALLALVRVTGGEGAVQPWLEAASGDAAAEVRWALLSALAETGPAVVYASKTLSGTLQALARQPEPRLRGAALQVLGRAELHAGPALQELARGLEDKSPEVAQAAAEALGWMGPLADSTVPVLERMSRKNTPNARLAGTLALGWIDRQSTQTLPALIKLIQEPAFWQATPADGPTPDAAAELRATLGGGPPDPARELLLVLGWTGPEAWPAAPVVAGMLRDRRNPPELRMLAGMTLLGISTQTLPSQIPPLFQQLKTRYGRRQLQAATALVWLGEKAAPALPELLRFLQARHCDAELRMAAAAAIGAMSTRAAAAVPALCEILLHESNPRVKAAVAAVLGGLGLSGKTATPPLIAALKDADGEVREASALALGKIGQDGPFAVPALVGAAGDAEPRVRLAVALALGGYGPGAREAQGVLQTLAAGDADPLVRKAALAALKKLAK